MNQIALEAMGPSLCVRIIETLGFFEITISIRADILGSLTLT